MILVLLSTIAVFALLIRYLLGFGFSMVFVPVASLVVDFGLTVALAVVLEIVIGGLMSTEHLRELDLLGALKLKLSAAIGAYGAAIIAKDAGESPLVIVSMCVLIASCAYLLWAPRLLRPNAATLLASGLMSGVLNSWASMSGPPIVVYHYSSTRPLSEIRGGLTGYFLVLYIFTFIVFVVQGRYEEFLPLWHVAILIAVVSVIYLTLRGRLIFKEQWKYRRASLIFVLAVAIIVLLKEIG